MGKTGKTKLVVTGILGLILAILMAVTVVGNVLAFGKYSNVLTLNFGLEGGTEQNYDTNQYFGRNASSAEEAAEQAEGLSKQIESEGAVLLKNNNNTLPLAAGNKVSCFSQSSVDIIYGSIGGSGDIDISKVSTLRTTLENVGITVNPTLWDFYAGKSSYRRVTGGLAGGTSKDPNKWAINEVPYSQYTGQVISSYLNYNDAAKIGRAHV